MRRGTRDARRGTLAVVLALVVGLGARALGDHGRGTTSAGASVAAGSSIANEQGRPIAIDRETKVSTGGFQLRNGTRHEISTARTVDGRSCVTDDDPSGGSGATCVDGDLFSVRKAAFSVASEGGPEAFSQLYVSGVVAPSVRSASVVLTDGTAVALVLTDGRGFLRESTAAELHAHVYPAALRLYGPSGKLVETITFPVQG